MCLSDDMKILNKQRDSTFDRTSMDLHRAEQETVIGSEVQGKLDNRNDAVLAWGPGHVGAD